MAIINFRKLYELVFKSFNVAADTELVTQLETDGVEKLIIIKRSWIFLLFISGKFIIMVAIMVANIYLIHKNFSDPTTSGILIGILTFSILFWMFSVIIYFIKFRKIYGERGVIVEITSIKNQLNEGDIAFTKFFNQTIFNYFILIGITLYIIYDLIFVVGFNEIGIYGGLNIFLLLTQIVLSNRFKKRMIDLEMDFALVIPGKIIFYNQSNITRSILTINSEKIKTITSDFSNLLGSIFNYGEISILTEGDAPGIGDMNLYFISHPSETVYEINELLGLNEGKKE